MRQIPFFFLLAAIFLTGCSARTSAKPAAAGADSSNAAAHTDSASASSDSSDELIEFNGITKMKSELSEDTIKWLEWYNTLSEDNQNALSFVPSEFIRPGTVYTLETENETTPAYTAALTEAELLETQELAHYYFTEASTGFEGVEEIYLAKDSDPLYQNIGIEAEYDPGNIIIYMVLTGKDKAAGNPIRSISIARRSKSDSWKVINTGF